MEYKEVLITPEIAQTILDKSAEVEQLLNLPSNRRLEMKRAYYYADLMKKGDWQNNGEDIHISKSGRLLNGQHRLKAIVLSGVSLQYGIKFNIDDDVSIYDRGRVRSTSDVLTLDGIPKELSNSTFVAVVRLHHTYFTKNTYISDADIERFILKHRKTFEQLHSLLKGRGKTKNGSRLSLKNSAIMLALMYAIEAGVDFNILDSFCEVLFTGIPQELDQSAALVLRNDFLSNNINHFGDSSRLQKIQMVEKAIYDFVNHYPRKISYKNTTEGTYSKIYKEDK